jgi:hypothetical protein
VSAIAEQRERARDVYAPAENLCRLVEADRLLPRGLSSEKAVVGREVEIAYHCHEDALRSDDPVLRLVIFLAVPPRRISGHVLALLTEGARHVGIQLDERGGVVNLRERLGNEQCTAGSEQREGDDGGPVFANGSEDCGQSDGALSSNVGENPLRRQSGRVCGHLISF